MHLISSGDEKRPPPHKGICMISCCAALDLQDNAVIQTQSDKQMNHVKGRSCGCEEARKG